MEKKRKTLEAHGDKKANRKIIIKKKTEAEKNLSSFIDSAVA